MIQNLPSGTGYVTSTAASKYSGVVAKAKKYWRQRLINRLTAFVEVKP